MNISLSKEQIGMLIEAIEERLSSFNDYHFRYECFYCSKNIEATFKQNNKHKLIHDDNCEGVKLLTDLRSTFNS